MSTYLSVIKDLTEKRITALEYTRRAYEGKVYWFDTFLFTKEDLSRIYADSPTSLGKKTTYYFTMGMSIAGLLDMQTAVDFIKAMSALVHEYEIMTTPHDTGARPVSAASHGRGGLRRVLTGQSRIFRSSRARQEESKVAETEFTYLMTPYLPFELNFLETVVTLCDVLVNMYVRIQDLLLSEENYLPSAIGDSFIRMDTKVKKLIVTPLINDIEEMCRRNVRNEVNDLEHVVMGHV
ncbi:uncharacterized protein V1510DRAFT_422322 [Dipodascopsis tothii]|uniref:uncharacterized protein n=1 Tax=Dipodascopsis tothii TaxID=44089 RepID=UPI0034CE9D56